MFKKYLVLIFGLGLIHSLAFARVEDPYWLSLKRLSFSINAAYHFNPWHNYNNAVAKVVHQIRLDSLFHEPTGFYRISRLDSSGSIAFPQNRNPIYAPKGLTWDGSYFWVYDTGTDTFAKLQLEGL